jgi:SAM-dependent methyltransferase
MPLRVAERRRQPELMDQPNLDPQSHEHALRGLERINFWSGACRVFWPGLWNVARTSPHRAVRVLDLACGAGDTAMRIMRKAQRAGLVMHIDGCDRSPTALEHARRRAADRSADTRFFLCDVLHDALPEGYDVLINSLFLHHLDEAEAEAFLRRAAGVAGRLFMVSDLVRASWGMVLAYAGTRLLTRSPIVHTDGPLSVAAAFFPDELRRLAESAGLHGASITRHWPCRMLLTWTKT